MPNKQFISLLLLVLKLLRKKQGKIITICPALLNPIETGWNVHIAAMRLRNASVATKLEEPHTACLKPADVL